MKRILVFLCLLLGWSAAAQTSREELISHLELTAGNYTNYPLPTGHLTPAPKGYEPFYISHYGRHGARYMTSDKYYRRLTKQLDSALKLGILTEYGKDVRLRVMLAAADARGRAGKLTELGGKQHRAIARRMYGNYQALMSEPLTVRAMSSNSGRVMRSMEHFCAELAELNPSLSITMSATEAEQGITKPNKSVPVPESETDGALYKKLRKFKHKMLSGERQMAALFSDVAQAKTFVDPYEFADDLFNMTADMECLPELKLDFTDLFGEDGMVDGFRAYNASWCLWEGLMPGARQSWMCVLPLLKNVVDEADSVITTGARGVRLRFGHDSVVLPFAYVLGFPEASNATDDMENLHLQFSIFRLIPMAANIQLIFFRKPKSKDVLVKFLMNENETAIPLSTDCYPYYHWSDVKKFYRTKLKEANVGLE